MLIDFNIHGVSIFGTILPLDSNLAQNFASWLPAGMHKVASPRKQEFIAGRYCASEAAKEIGFNLVNLPSAATREPIWPEGIIGSISHSKLMAISCVSDSKNLSSIGIDAEELIKLEMLKDIEKVIATQDELKLISSTDNQTGVTILFSAKESLYKALFPLVRTFIDFNEVKLVSFDFAEKTFELQLVSTNAALAKHLGFYKGSFYLLGTTIVTIVSIPKNEIKDFYVYS